MDDGNNNADDECGVWWWCRRGAPRRPQRVPGCQEADRAFRDAAAADEVPADGGGGGGGGAAADERELTGMACLLKDGFIGYLRELAKITPPVPKQVIKRIRTPSISNCKSFQESWRVKAFSRLTKIIEKNTKICNVK